MEIMKRVIMFQMMMIILLLCLMMISTTAVFAGAANTGNVIDPSCQAHCGNNVSIPYPFGIGAAGCYVDDWFEVVCIDDNNNNNNTDSSSNSSGSGPLTKPFLKRINLEVLDIQLEEAKVRVNYPVVSKCDASRITSSNRTELAGSPFVFSVRDNWFVAMTNICDITISLWSPDDLVSYGGCRTGVCVGQISNSCNRSTDEYCCRTTIPSNFGAFTTKIDQTLTVSGSRGCSYSILVDISWFLGYFTTPDPKMSVPVVLDWGIPMSTFSDGTNNSSTTRSCTQDYPSFQGILTFKCLCKFGFEGNPYIPKDHGGGCQDIDECANVTRIYEVCGNDARCENTYGSYRCIPPAKDTRFSIIIGISTSLGVLVMLIGGWRSYKVVKKRKMIKQREKFFKRNGGLLLQQRLYSSEGNVENNKLFSSKDLEKATDHFNANRILGQGGQGTVYKGMLTDGRIVAIKKSKIIDEGQLEGFINEVVILSQINQ